MARELIYPLEKGTLSHIGHKAELLQFLRSQNISVPQTFVCVWDAFDRYQAGDPTLSEQLRIELTRKLGDTQKYAVRSSANVEDGRRFSFAGQFRTILDVSGTEPLVTAIKAVWDSVHTGDLDAYLQTTGVKSGQIKMAVLLQEMVTPVASGVVFSKNPLTGLDEVIVEAVQGSGETLMQGSAKPLRWVYKWGEWISQPANPDVPIEIIQHVVDGTRSIARRYGEPVDLEWVYDGDQVYWVQIRAITSLDNLTFYSNRIAKEVLPGLIKPLVWSVNVPLVNSAWVELLTELIGPNDIDPMSLSRSFYGRAYFNMGVLGDVFELLGFPRETLELMMGLENAGPDRPGFKPTRRTFRHMPRMIRFALDKWRFARKFENRLPDLQAKYDTFRVDDLSQLNEQALLAAVDDLFELTRQAAYYNIVIPLLMQLYNQLLNRQLRRLGVDPARFELTEDLEPLKRLDPNEHLVQLRQQYQQLPDSVRTEILDDEYTTFCARPGIKAFQAGVADFLEQFGHLSDSGNDFSVVPWREQPEIVLGMVTRMTSAGDRHKGKLKIDDLHVPLKRRWLFKLTYRRARQFRLYREQISSLYTYGYGLFRSYFLALGDCLVRRGVIPDRHDVFFFELDEIRTLVKGEGDERADIRIADRKSDLEQAQNLTPPETIFGDTPVPLQKEFSEQLTGVPTSRGYYRGRVRVVRGIQDFDKLQSGDVLVIPYSDVGWTPLFAKAGAVISESGGMLSHSSIVAREYNIPAVVSVPLACQLPDGSEVSVDGFKGEIFIHQEKV
jgi:phosphohistidine swiveling domain-containing protein